MSWEMVRLGDVCETSSGGTPNRSTPKFWMNGSIPWIKSGQLKDNIINESEEFITENGFKNSSAKMFPNGTLLLALYGATAGKLGFLGLDATTNQAICSIIPDSKLVDKKFLYYHLLFKRSTIIADSTGGAQPNISQAYVKDLEIPLPPLPIQKRIAEILDAADALKRKDQELLKKYDELAQAIFIDMFGDPVKNEKGFKVQKLAECLERIQIGPFGTQLHESDYISDGIPIINPMHMGDLKIKPNSKYSISKEKHNQLPQYHLKEGDVILGRRGEMGRCALVTNLEAGFLCGTGSLFITVSKKILNPAFLVYLLSRDSTKRALENAAAGTTMSNLNKSIINEFEIIIPSIKEQKKFMDSIIINQLNIEIINRSINTSEMFFQSLIQKAFNGELAN